MLYQKHNLPQLLSGSLYRLLHVQSFWDGTSRSRNGANGLGLRWLGDDLDPVFHREILLAIGKAHYGYEPESI